MISSQCSARVSASGIPLAGEAGEAHEAVERLPPARDLGERGRDRLLVGGVERDRERGARRRVPLDRGRQIQHRDLEAVGERCRDEGAADAPATAGNGEPRAGCRTKPGGGRSRGSAGHGGADTGRLSLKRCVSRRSSRSKRRPRASISGVPISALSSSKSSMRSRHGAVLPCWLRLR